MREIKFRFFSNPDEKMYVLTLLGLNWESESDPPVYGGKNVWDGREGTRVQRYSDGHLMQFTGLKDKNGKDIYEGDRVRCWGGEYCQGYWEQDRIIEIKDMINDCFMMGEHEFLEVLGNIHTSPELLEGGTPK